MTSEDQQIFYKRNHAACFDTYRILDDSTMKRWLSVVENLLIKFQDDHPCIILDAGAGTGRFTIPIAINFKHKVVAIDKSKEMLSELRKKAQNLGIHNIDIFNLDIEQIEAHEKYALIFLSEVLHLIPNLERICQLLYSSLRKDGSVCIRTPSHKQLEKIEWLSYFKGALDFDKKRTTDVFQIISYLNNSGFSEISTSVIDESKHINTDSYIEMLKKKSFSILNCIDEKSLEDGFKKMHEDLKERDYCCHTMELTCICATKRE